MPQLRFVTIVTWFLCTAVPSFGAVDDAILTHAEQCVKVGALSEAITEYKRFVFFFPDSLPGVVHVRIADLLRESGRYQEAAHYLESAYRADTGSLHQSRVRIKQALLNVADGRPREAEIELIRIGNFALDSIIRNQAFLYLCLVYVSQGELKKAHTLAASKPGVHELRKIDSILEHWSCYRYKSPKLARWMSTFIPGLGQIYADERGNGINALGISLLTGFQTYNSIAQGFYQQAILTDCTLFWRYYDGNRWNARKAAQEYNKKQAVEVRKKIVESLNRTIPFK